MEEEKRIRLRRVKKRQKISNEFRECARAWRQIARKKYITKLARIKQVSEREDIDFTAFPFALTVESYLTHREKQRRLRRRYEILFNGRTECSCPAGQYMRNCRHVMMAALARRVRDEQRVLNEVKEATKKVAVEVIKEVMRNVET